MFRTPKTENENVLDTPQFTFFYEDKTNNGFVAKGESFDFSIGGAETEVGMLLPAVQMVREAARRKGDDACPAESDFRVDGFAGKDTVDIDDRFDFVLFDSGDVEASGADNLLTGLIFRPSEAVDDDNHLLGTDLGISVVDTQETGASRSLPELEFSLDTSDHKANDGAERWAEGFVDDFMGWV